MLRIILSLSTLLSVSMAAAQAPGETSPIIPVEPMMVPVPLAPVPPPLMVSPEPSSAVPPSELVPVNANLGVPPEMTTPAEELPMPICLDGELASDITIDPPPEAWFVSAVLPDTPLFVKDTCATRAAACSGLSTTSDGAVEDLANPRFSVRERAGAWLRKYYSCMLDSDRHPRSVVEELACYVESAAVNGNPERIARLGQLYTRVLYDAEQRRAAVRRRLGAFFYAAILNAPSTLRRIRLAEYLSLRADYTRFSSCAELDNGATEATFGDYDDSDFISRSTCEMLPGAYPRITLQLIIGVPELTGPLNELSSDSASLVWRPGTGVYEGISITGRAPSELVIDFSDLPPALQQETQRWLLDRGPDTAPIRFSPLTTSVSIQTGNSYGGAPIPTHPSLGASIWLRIAVPPGGLRLPSLG